MSSVCAQAGVARSAQANAGLSARSRIASVPKLVAVSSGSSASNGRSLRLACRADDARWPLMRKKLMEAKVRSLPNEAIEAARADGALIVDVRPAEDFEAYHIPGSKNVPLFVPLESNSADKLMKKFIYAINGMKGVDENPKFIEQMQELASPGTPMVVTCDTGGEYLPFGQTPDGRRSRSLVAIYKLLTAGFKDVYHVASGTIGWAEEGRELAGTDPSKWERGKGRAPRT